VRILRACGALGGVVLAAFGLVLLALLGSGVAAAATAVTLGQSVRVPFSSATSVNVALSSRPEAGQLLIFCEEVGANVGLTGPAGWFAFGGSPVAEASPALSSGCWWESATGSESSVTSSWGSSATGEAEVDEFDGFGVPPVLDVEAEGTTVSGTSSVALDVANPVGMNDVVFAFTGVSASESYYYGCYDPGAYSASDCSTTAVGTSGSALSYWLASPAPVDSLESGWQIGYPTTANGELFGAAFEDVAGPVAGTSSADTDIASDRSTLLSYVGDVAALVVSVGVLSIGLMMIMHWAKKGAMSS
jgi:hypothetical protein